MPRRRSAPRALMSGTGASWASCSWCVVLSRVLTLIVMSRCAMGRARDVREREGPRTAARKPFRAALAVKLLCRPFGIHGLQVSRGQ